MNMTFDNFKMNLLQPNEDEAFFNLINNNRARLEDFFAGTVSKTQTLDDTIAYCIEIQNRINAKSYFPYMITDIDNGKFIGLVDVKNICWDIPKAEIGYFIDKGYQGRGIVSKAFSTTVDYLISTYKFKKLLCRVGSQNQSSINVVLKNKFELEGTIRNDYKTTRGVIVDLNYYGRVFD